MSGLPNMAPVLNRWLRPVTIKTVTEDTVDFEPVQVVTPRTQQCVVQVARKEQLNADTIDWSLEYIRVHSKEGIEQGEFVEFEGIDYKVIERGRWRGYGFVTVIAEERKGSLL